MRIYTFSNLIYELIFTYIFAVTTVAFIYIILKEGEGIHLFYEKIFDIFLSAKLPLLWLN